MGAHLYRFDPHPDPAAGPTQAAALAYQPSDVCLFAGTVLVGERAAPRLHAYAAADLATDLGPLTLAGGAFVRACAADASRVYVVLAGLVGDGGAAPDEIVEVAVTPTLAEGTHHALPTGLGGGESRLLDLAYDRRGGQLYGLFVDATTPATAAVVAFTPGGAVGATVAAPFALTNLGTFAP
jgi:hypothetical protein